LWSWVAEAHLAEGAALRLADAQREAERVTLNFTA
jgi:hypothetical protein